MILSYSLAIQNAFVYFWIQNGMASVTRSRAAGMTFVLPLHSSCRTFLSELKRWRRANARDAAIVAGFMTCPPISRAGRSAQLPSLFLAMPTRASTHAIIRFHCGVGRDAQAVNEKRADLPIDVQNVETRPSWSTGQLVLSDAITAAAARTAP